MIPSRLRVVFALAISLTLPACVDEDRPPRPGSDPASVRGFGWIEEVTPGARILRTDPAVAPELASRVAQARQGAAALLGRSDTAPRPDVYVVSSRDEMRRLTGLDVIGLTIGGHGALVVLDSLPLLERSVRHELAHWMTRGLLPRPRRIRPWVDEGIASLATGNCGGRSWSAVAALLLSGDRLPGLDAVEALPAIGGDFATYVAGAALLEWAADRSGRGVFPAAWAGGVPGLLSELDLSAEEAEAEWRAALETSLASVIEEVQGTSLDSPGALEIPDRCS